MSLSLRIRSSLFWIAWSSGMRFCMQFGLSIVLARLLSPADFGRTGMVAGVLAIIAPLAGASLQDAVIAAPDESRERMSSLFWLGLSLGAGATVACVLAAPLIALYYKDPSLEPLTQALACSFVFTGMGAVPEGLLRKRLAFNVVSRVEIGLSVITSLAAVGCALLGYGVWSLIVQAVAYTGLACVTWWIASGFRPLPSMQRDVAIDGLRFGTTVSLLDVVSLIANTAHTFVIGRFMGAAPVGLYARALGIPQLLQQQVGGLANTVTLPALAAIEDEARVKSAVLQTSAAIALVTAPIAFGLVACGDLVIAVLYGGQWLAAATPLRILAVATFVQVALFPIAAVYRARRRPDLALRVGLFAMVLSLVGVTAGTLLGGLVLVASLHLARVILIAAPHVMIGGGLVGLKLAEMARAVRSPIGCAVAMTAVVLAVRPLLTLTPVAELTIAIAIGAAVYGGLAVGLQIEPLRNVLRFLRQRSGAVPARPDAPR